MGDAAEGFTCRQCGRAIDDESGERRGWCDACRAAVVRRSGAWAVLPALLVAAGYAWLLDSFGLYRSNFVIIFLALGVAIVWVAFKIARRVLFDVIRGRAARRLAR